MVLRDGCGAHTRFLNHFVFLLLSSVPYTRARIEVLPTQVFLFFLWIHLFPPISPLRF
ncbi:hypothetical protein HanIR_Chr09g0401471 [Helianthus annuus]|nr:hypothetical protein HanIR_Chr09g0401471 [Helianthus annuus]